MPLSIHADLARAWDDIQAELRRTVGVATFDAWLGALQAVDWDGTVLTVCSPPQTRSWVSERYGATLRACASSVLGSEAKIDLAAGDESDGRAGSLGRRGRQAGARRGASEIEAAIEIEPSFSLNPRLSFAQFVIGAGNRLAHAAALAVAENPGQTVNPLFLHAPPGLGKTHLLHAIGNYVLAFGGGATVRYTTVESFTNNFIQALNTRSLDRFKHAYRDADVLLIDDVQFLASKVRTEEEFFHTFNAVHENGRQLVITSDRPPKDLVAVEDRLRERFGSGLVATIQPPDPATRLAILRKRAALDRVTVADDRVLELIAERVRDNVRALEGALIRVVAHHSLTGRRLDLNSATEVLDEIHPGASRAVSIADVQQHVCGRFGLTSQEILSTARTARIAGPRQLAMYLARELTTASLPAIGSAFGGRDHTTVHYALRRVSDRLRDDAETADTLAELRAKIEASRDDRHD